jgi:CRP/FNR family transcriptional regulator, cyclic AMP receptor protein
VPRATVRGVGVPAHVVLAGSVRRLPHDTVVVRQDEPSTALFVVERGAMRLSAVTADGRELVVAVLGSGDVFGEAALLEERSPVEARTVGETIVIAFDAGALPIVFREAPATGAELLRLVASRLHRTERALGDALTSDLATRIVTRLHELGERHGVRRSDGVHLTIPLTQDELARMVGASREAVNRSLRGLADADLVRTGRTGVVITDPDALARGRS